MTTIERDELRLYRVDVSGVAYVMAAGGREAARVVESALAPSDYDLPVFLASLNRAEPVDPAWADCQPLGEDEERTVDEIIAAYLPDRRDLEWAGQLRLHIPREAARDGA